MEDECSENHAALAKALIARHIRNSVPDSVVQDWLAKQTVERYPAELVQSSMRCIVVVGAGASAPLLARGGELAQRLEGLFGRDEVELERLQLVNNLNPRAFETRLIALSKTADAARRVQNTIAEEYKVRHPTVLAYELIAHLLKHRFVDAVISFNFDELLDRSLDDELTPSEYRRLVSDRDCDDVEPNADQPSYVPLYVKLHGTASEPYSLRFTPDSYYTLPAAMVKVVQDLLHVERCVIVNVGCGLASFDFQRLLGIPTSVDIYDLSYTPLDGHVKTKIDDERRRARGLEPIRDPAEKRDLRWLHSCANEDDKCDQHLEALCSALEQESRSIVGILGQIVQFRSIQRHKVAAHLFGGTPPPVATPDDRWYKQSEIDYLKRRAILELAFAGAKARGLMSLVPLARDRPGRYFELYQQRTNWHGESWHALCSAAGLIESASIPDVLLSAENLRETNTNRETGEDPTHKLEGFDPRALAIHIARRIKNPAEDADIDVLAQTIDELQQKADVELHTQDDRVCSKAFKQPLTLRTATALKIYTWLMFDTLKPEDHVYISTETGAWLLDLPIAQLLKKQAKLKLLLAFDIEHGNLRQTYEGSNLKLRCTNPWHHNRHMTIVCDGKTPKKAIYFARHLRTPVITPVYLESQRDTAHLLRTFVARWAEASELETRITVH